MAEYKHYFVANGREQFASKSEDDFDWEGFQKHMRLTDEQLKYWQTDPDKSRFAPMMTSEFVTAYWMIIEAIHVESCGNGLREGDRLYFKALGHLVPELSDAWCGHAMHYIGMMQDQCHNMLLQGKSVEEINETLFPDVFSCFDTTMQYGWGNVIARVFLVRETDMEKFNTRPSHIERWAKYKANQPQF